MFQIFCSSSFLCFFNFQNHVSKSWFKLLFLFCYVNFIYSVWIIEFILMQCFTSNSINHTYGFNCTGVIAIDLCWMNQPLMWTIFLLCRFPARSRLSLRNCCRPGVKWRGRTKTMSRSPRRRRSWPRTRENSLFRSLPQVTKGNNVTCIYHMYISLPYTTQKDRIKGII